MVKILLAFSLVFSGFVSAMACPSGSLIVDGVRFGPEALAGMVKTRIVSAEGSDIRIVSAQYCINKDERTAKVQSAWVSIDKGGVIRINSNVVGKECMTARSVPARQEEVAPGVSVPKGCGG